MQIIKIKTENKHAMTLLCVLMNIIPQLTTEQQLLKAPIEDGSRSEGSKEKSQKSKQKGLVMTEKFSVVKTSCIKGKSPITNLQI